MELPVYYPNANWRVRRKVREEYITRQDRKCFWCESSLDEKPPKHIRNKKIDWNLFPPNFLKHLVHLQHCHETGMTEGAVHAYCNAVMWQYHKR